MTTRMQAYDFIKILRAMITPEESDLLVEMPAGSKKYKSSIISEHCMGCGLCVFNCPQKALTLEIVRPPEHIPTIPREKLLGWGKGF
jgi:ferredoxin